MIERGHYGVKVMVDQVFRTNAKVTYLSPGWQDEAVGDNDIVEFFRLKPFSECIFFTPNSKVKDAFQEFQRKGKISDALVAKFDHA